MIITADITIAPPIITLTGGISLYINQTHIGANIVSNKSYDYTDGDNNPVPTGNTGDHGTSVAGIIAAVGWNNLGVRGVAPKAKLVGYNYTDGSNASISNFADAVVDYNAQHGTNYTVEEAKESLGQ